ncbi:hypothetical protein [Saccharolobus islandicus]|uniref:Uncharacterized protein n=1 Tax=Saccharolobus islandicus (strain L.D.8.5 / Lassen \|nr:hypothetical protein [Sulfolobus islandicus]ADB86327.1 hypothetical protein LD85_0584 [Sulfolobus islandicus L.D.8.5]
MSLTLKQKEDLQNVKKKLEEIFDPPIYEIPIERLPEDLRYCLEYPNEWKYVQRIGLFFKKAVYLMIKS